MSFFDPDRLRRRLPTPDDFRRARQGWYRVVLLAALTGVLVGLAVALFEWVVGKGLLGWTLGLPDGLQWCAPAIGLVLAWCALRFAGHGASLMQKNHGVKTTPKRRGNLGPAACPPRDP